MRCSTIGLIILAIQATASADEQSAGTVSAGRVHSQLFRHQYSIRHPEFCSSEVCVDFDNDGCRELLYATRHPSFLQMRSAADGSLLWSRRLPGQQQSTSAFDLDGDGLWEVVYTVSDPGVLYVCDRNGQVIQQWQAGDHKLGNSPVIIDADADGVLEGYLGTRSRFLTRVSMGDLSVLQQRANWIQCGCHTSAMDVDRDGRWDLFAGSGDDISAKGVLHRLNPLTLKSEWTYSTNDNASSADAVLVDINGDGVVEIIKSVDNYRNDDAHDAVMAFTVDGELLWKAAGLSGEDSPNVADLDGDGQVEIVGMTFRGTVYCLNAQGKIKWERDLRPELRQDPHMYLAPILCDLDGDSELEILAMTNGPYALSSGTPPAAMLHALDASGRLLDTLDLGESRYWGHAFVCNVDDDAYLELVVSGRGGLDVIETRGYGSNTEHFQRRRSYQRLNVRRWAYADQFFMERGERQRVVNGADNLILTREGAEFASAGQFVTELLTLPTDAVFRELQYLTDTPADTRIQVDVLAADQRLLHQGIASGTDLQIAQPLRLAFRFSTKNPLVTPTLRSYRLDFQRQSGIQ